MRATTSHPSLGEIGGKLSRFPFVFTLAQDDHERFLIGKLRELGVDVRWNCRLQSLRQQSDRVEVTLHDGQAERTVDYAWVCGCDGAHSTVREGLGVGFAGGTYEGLFYVADVQIADARQGELVAHLETGTFMLMMPVRRDGGVRLVGIVGDSDSQPEFKQLQPGIEAVIGSRVERVNWFSTYRVHHRVVSNFRDGRCFLLGDAAHLHSPAGGQGMNTGIGDATNLAWKLAAVVKGEASEAVLDSYDLERRPFAEQLVATTDRVFMWVVDSGLAGRFLRRVLLPRAAPFAMRFDSARVAFFRRISQIAVRYPDSPLSEGAALDVRGGDRFPYVPGDQRHDVQSSPLGWTARVYGEVGDDADRALTKLAIPLLKQAWSTKAADVGLERDAIYLVRPDGYIGFTGLRPSAAAIAGYWGRVSGSG
jgi:2-polyprenyl-6-methoxyphenol hydroxylase-like FAD-dependent oxidoreductase